ncbi:hypothetical protein BAUCODRAFT_332766 [Baudoinia panamericana UAMH 10762]|uniref:Ubiquitin-like protease family profile domain-containing protein n=1 Tax=Baudoinia panamericana (strain UAMH 10762) TaxID=717646 RepID=M2M365_BAUPA|nr:uncharacterized protein BAUCODRAFT_332766 [Baudoinia panamericana UAMH 10762]EMC90981.1 hypothetical protein BAUCODRAFT_332766 [Baudoinia panamericana UAMH 10762]
MPVLREQTNKYRIDQPSPEHLIVPVHWSSIAHWMIAVLHLEQDTFEVFDPCSLRTSTPSPALHFDSLLTA